MTDNWASHLRRIFDECTPANNCEQLLMLLSALRATTFTLC
jgi:hypothetical protein